ncbi:MAG: membrane lipoprotein lipid attachment site-containing protein [Alistipes sp.]|nr:membrane lipoprotein lipid attachment site-containing protein [Alistipes sp.]
MRRTLLLAFAVFVLAACSKDTTETPDLSTDKIYASILPTDATRVELNANKQTVWTAGDYIVVPGPADMRLYQFDGQTGDRNGTFTYRGTYNVTNYATDYVFDRYYAYLRQETVSLGRLNNGTPVLFMDANSVQHYKKGSYGATDNLIVGASDDGKNFSFQNVLGYLRLSITGDKAVKSITLTGNNEEPIAGQIYCPISDIPNAYWYQKESTITLDCGTGVQLTDSPTEFYIVVPPVTFSKGFTVVLTFTDGSTYLKSTSKAVTIARNMIQPMKNFATNGEVQQQVVTIEHTGSWIAAPLLKNAMGSIEWGDGTTSLLDELTSFTYTDGAASHTITIKATNVTTVELTNCTGITKLDVSNL